MDSAMLMRIAIVISVMLIVVALGLRCALPEAAFLLRRPSLLVRSLVAMNLIMPLIAVWLVSSFDLKTPVKVALVALAISPLPPFLPGKRLKLTSSGYIYGIVVAAAVCSVVLVPVTAALLSAHFHTQHVTAVEVFLVVVITVLAPLSIGLFIQRIRPSIAALRTSYAVAFSTNPSKRASARPLAAQTALRVGSQMNTKTGKNNCRRWQAAKSVQLSSARNCAVYVRR